MPATLPPEVKSALDGGHVVEAIKLLRASGMEATEIKEAVDAYMRNPPPRFQKKDPGRSGPDVMAHRISTPSDTVKSLSPGEVSRGSGWWPVVLAVAVALAGWWVLRRLS